MIRKDEEFLKVVSVSLVDLPTPSSISYLWNFGSLLGVFLVFQVVTGMFLALHFSGDFDLSFSSVIHLMRDVNYGWLIRVFHSNGASLFFLFLYFHVGRGIYYGSYHNEKSWMSGITILLAAMATAFLGYVLPWGQMSFWAATVITNLLSAIPYVGKMMVEWVWGGFAVGNPTLTRFFAFHFILPFVIVFLVVIHLVYLHEVGSNNPLGLMKDSDKLSFHPYFLAKDMMGFLLAFMFLILLSLFKPYMFMDCENFIPSNPLVTPTHIQPEWYFLFAYSILRSISSKVGGVVALMMSVLIYYFFPLFTKSEKKMMGLNSLSRVMFWILVGVWILLTWMGAQEVEPPFISMGGVISFLYFLLFFFIWSMTVFQESVLE